MNISVIDPGWDFMPLVITGSIAAFLLLIATLVSVLEYNDVFYDDTSWVWAVAIPLSIIVVLVGGVFFQAATYENRLNDRVIEALEDQGFKNVDMDSNQSGFTASLDGEYFDGVLIEVGDLEWQIAEIKAVDE